MTAAAIAPAQDSGTGDPGLIRALRRVERRAQSRALLLIAPLFLFLLITFLAPIAMMLWRAVADTDVAGIMPRTVAALRIWDGTALPSESAYAALIDDVRAARKAGNLASAATRLNYDVNGFRTLLFSTGRRLPETSEESAKGALTGIDAKWGEIETWAAIKRAGGPLTGFFLLAALDARRSADGTIAGVGNQQAIFVPILWRTLGISGGVTLLCLLLGYPLAYVLAQAEPKTANLLLILVLLPFWTSLLVRTTAWVVLLQREGVINDGFLKLGLIAEPLSLLFTRLAVTLAMTHVLLPFMILPIYSVMKSVPATHMRAALSLGARPGYAFWRVYFPQTLPGIGAGVLMVFIQALGYYITPALVGGANDQMISYFIAFYANRTINWGMAAALSIMLLAATMVLYAIYNKLVGIDRVRLG
jgi:putative spermidine/putrescine transport system permease protein